jgi:hypothetical protein
MDVFSIGFVATILFATSLGVWLALRETTCVESKPPKKYFSLPFGLRTSLVCLLRALLPFGKSTNLKSLKTLSKELWNNGRYEEAYWLKEEIERIKLLMLKK